MNMFDLLKMLDEAMVEFVLVGGLAVALHGYQRVTMDVDVVVAMDDENLQRFMSAAKAAGLRPTIPVPLESLAQPKLIEQWYREMGQAGKPHSGCSQKGMLAFSLRGNETMATVLDVLVRPKVSFSELRRDATLVKVGPIDIPVASIAHLIAMKTGTGRGKDAVDIEELRKLQAQQ
ncbi:MAG TPA: hypothetical protein VFQ98_03865 [Gallionella sp.]|nr:hypothetical protein [Gallionella sp.]